MEYRAVTEFITAVDELPFDMHAQKKRQRGSQTEIPIPEFDTLEEQSSNFGFLRFLKPLAFGLLLVSMIVYLWIDGGRIETWFVLLLDALKEWGLGGILILSFLIILGCLIFIPYMLLGTILSAVCLYVAGGGFSGILFTLLWVWFISVLADLACMLLGRYAMRKYVKRWIFGTRRQHVAGEESNSEILTPPTPVNTEANIFTALDAVIAEGGWWVCLLCRLNLYIPSTLFAYFCGITGIRIKDFIIGSIGLIPWTVVYLVFAISAVSMPTQSADAYNRETSEVIPQWLLLTIMGVSAIVMLVVLSFYTKHKIQEMYQRQ